MRPQSGWQSQRDRGRIPSIHHPSRPSTFGPPAINIATPDSESRDLLSKVAERFGLTARGYHRVLRVARTIADLDGSDHVARPHVAEAVSYRLIGMAQG